MGPIEGIGNESESRQRHVSYGAAITMRKKTRADGTTLRGVSLLRIPLEYRISDNYNGDSRSRPARRLFVSDPKGEPHSHHPQEDEFDLEFAAEPEAAAPHAEEHAADINASTEEFHFSGPLEELDFTEPADFTFPAEEAAEVEPISDSSAEIPAPSTLASITSSGARKPRLTKRL